MHRPAASAPSWSLFGLLFQKLRVSGPTLDQQTQKLRLHKIPVRFVWTNSPGHRGRRLWNLASFIFQIDNHGVQQKLGIHCHHRPCSAERKHRIWMSHRSQRQKPTPPLAVTANIPRLCAENLPHYLNRWASDPNNYLWELVNTNTGCPSRARQRKSPHTCLAYGMGSWYLVRLS